MDWVQIGSAVFLVAMIVFLFPRARDMLNNSPKAERGDWQGAILPLAGVVAFIALLVWMVRN